MASLIESDIYTSDEEILSNKVDVSIEDSSSSEDFGFVRSGKTRRPRAIYSDNEEDAEHIESRALSPRTRMSITGIIPSDLSDNSSEIDYSSADETKEPKSDEEINSTVNETNDIESDSQINDTRDILTSESSAIKNISAAPRTTSKYVDLNSSANARYSNVFGNSTIDKLSSTLNQEKLNRSNNESGDSSEESDIFGVKQKESTVNIDSDDANKSLTASQKIRNIPINDSDDSSDVIVVSNKECIVDISSDENDLSTNERDAKPILGKQDIKKYVQPRITNALYQPASSSKNVATRKLVSPEFYEKEVKKLNELKSDLLSAESLLDKLGPSLYDGGKQLSLRIASLKMNVKKKAEEIVNFNIEVNTNANVSDEPKQTIFNGHEANWDDLSAAVNEIKPAFTGKQGLNTFNQQKVLTIERLKDLHGSLETCPSDDVLADDPKGLKITLMDHQKHALAWMNWREHQKPRGGILADDMGLGKTLTMISMVLASKNQDDNGNKEDSSDGEEKENQEWLTKNRRDNYNGGTLVVCPASLMRQWEGEVENKVTRHKLSVCVHHGNNRDTKPRHLATYDIVITTYNIVSREAKTQGALFSINWKRIILDEAHVVRNHKSQSCLAVCNLLGRYRWVLTGTPIQNKEMDVYALLKFIKCTPFDDLSHWKKWIDNKSAGGQQRLNTLIKSLMLRRTKAQLQQHGSLMCLPTRECKLIEVILDKDEMNVYQKIMTYSKTLFAQFLYQRAEKNNDLYFNDQAHRATFMQTKDPNGAFHKMHQKFSQMHHGGKEIKSHEILVLLLRLRQICCHPGLIDAMLEDEDGSAHTSTDSVEPEIDLLEQLNKLAITDNPTKRSELTDSLDESNQHNHQALSKAFAKVLQRSNPVFDLNRPSSKMNKVLHIVREQVVGTSDKGIIISQWTSVLNILKKHFEADGVRTLSLNGTIPVKNRQNIVSEFNDPNTKPKILLLSLTAGGVGLNLVGANHLLLIDLHWNPQLEAQAQDRIYRVGQKKPVYIYKFMCKDTVEERIKALQDQKLSIANDLLTGVKASEGSKLSIDDLKGLFGL